MQRMTGRTPRNDPGRLSRAVVWLSVSVRLGVSGCLLILAALNGVHHKPVLLIAAPLVLAVIGGAFALALALGQRD